jgi:hypothetical protein
MSNITIGKTNTSIGSLRDLLRAFKFETVDTDGDIEFVASDFGFTWIRDDGDSIQYPMLGDVVHYWSTLAEAMSHSNESNYVGREEFDAQVAEFQAFMDEEMSK